MSLPEDWGCGSQSETDVILELGPWELTWGLGCGIGLVLGFLVELGAHFPPLPQWGGEAVSLHWLFWCGVGCLAWCKDSFSYALQYTFSYFSLYSGAVIPHLESSALVRIFLCMVSCSKRCF